MDLESAYVQGCERLEQAVLVSAGCPARPPGPGWGRVRAPTRLRPPRPQAVKALQTATREAIALLQAMLEEVRRSAAEEEASIHSLFASLQVREGGRPATGWASSSAVTPVPMTEGAPRALEEFPAPAGQPALNSQALATVARRVQREAGPAQLCGGGWVGGWGR